MTSRSVLIVPSIVLEEFERNKDQVTQNALRPLQSSFRALRDAVRRFAKGRTKW